MLSDFRGSNIRPLSKGAVIKSLGDGQPYIELGRDNPNPGVQT